MSKTGEQDTAGRRWISAPAGSMPVHTGTITGTWLNPGERVDWHWCHVVGGSYVSGYTIHTPGKNTKVCPMGRLVAPVHVKITNPDSGWNGEFGIIERGIGENGCFSIRLESGTRTAFGGNEFTASDRNPPVR